jgi:hypothetical protein
MERRGEEKKEKVKKMKMKKKKIGAYLSILH